MQTIRHPSILASPALLAAACALSACAVDAEPTLDEIEIGTDCPNFGCNSNSPVVGWPPFHELDEGEPDGGSARRASRGRRLAPPDLDQGGAFNGSGLRVVRIEQYGVQYRLDVRGDELKALDEDGNLMLEGEDLVDAVIVLEHWDDTRYYVFLEEFSDTLTFWVGDVTETVEAFYLSWSFNIMSPKSARQKVCKLPGTFDDWKGAAFHQAIFFQGDRYDAETKEVIATGSDVKGWFNVACASSATAKMHVTRHSEPGSSPGFTAEPLDRQALLKMYIADYCRNGHPFTEVGEAIRWENEPGWKTIDLLPGSFTYESVWDSGGAVCLSTPRMGDTKPEAMETLGAISSICGEPPPSCSSLFGWPKSWKHHGYIRTANPNGQ